METPASDHGKRVSLAPLSFEDAMRGLLAAGPHPKDDETEEKPTREPAKLKDRKQKK